MSKPDQSAPTKRIMFVGECDRCDRNVAVTVPMRSPFTEQSDGITVHCKECEHTVRAYKHGNPAEVGH